MERKALFIINPNSGRKRIRIELYNVVAELLEGGVVPTIRYTERKGHAAELAASASQDEFDFIICAGGDGTLNEVMSGIINSGNKLPLGYIPAGSTCDFAATLGISKNMNVAAYDICHGNIHSIDVGKLSDSHFSYVASFGIFTSVSYTTTQAAKNLLGHAAYMLASVKDITVVHDHHMHVETDDDSFDDNFIFGAVANATSIGGVLTIDPSDVALDDGRFEYLFLKRPANIADLITTIDAITSYNYKSDKLYFGSTKKLKIQSSEALDWSLDGEQFSPGREFLVENLHGAVSLILPDYREKNLLRG